jgi:hypothetical protein
MGKPETMIAVPEQVIRLLAKYEVEDLCKPLENGAIAILLFADHEKLIRPEDATDLLHAQLTALEECAAQLRAVLKGSPRSPARSPS